MPGCWPSRGPGGKKNPAPVCHPQAWEAGSSCHHVPITPRWEGDSAAGSSHSSGGSHRKRGTLRPLTLNTWERRILSAGGYYVTRAPLAREKETMSPLQLSHRKSASSGARTPGLDAHCFNTFMDNMTLFLVTPEPLSRGKNHICPQKRRLLRKWVSSREPLRGLARHPSRAPLGGHRDSDEQRGALLQGRTWHKGPGGLLAPSAAKWGQCAHGRCAGHAWTQAHSGSSHVYTGRGRQGASHAWCQSPHSTRPRRPRPHSQGSTCP